MIGAIYSFIHLISNSQGKEIERRNQEKIIHAPSLYWIILLDEDINIDRLMPLSSNIDINQVRRETILNQLLSLISQIQLFFKSRVFQQWTLQ